MGIDWFRDLVIAISGLVLIVVLIFIAVLAFSLYRRARSILDSVRATSKTIQEVSSYAGNEVVKPITQVVALIQGVRQGIDAVGRLFGRKEGGKDG